MKKGSKNPKIVAIFEKAESSFNTGPAGKWRHRSYVSKELNISSKLEAGLLDPSKNIRQQQPGVGSLRCTIMS